MRPVWLEFPEDLNELDTQFMFGDALFVSPKVKLPGYNGLTEVQVNLPQGAKWYHYWSQTLV
jgi:alpha-glucosidase (family GH31 glycosyl hydrolase)